jgi:hypothetical protein
MKRAKPIASIAIAAATAVVTAAWVAQSGRVLMNGQVLSSSVKTINGTAYVKLSDVAKAFNMTVVKKGADFELVKAGGANQLQGTTGKLGQEIFTGKWRFVAKSLTRAQSYAPIYSVFKDDAPTAEDGQELIVIPCRLKNGMTKKENMYMQGGNTSITDMDEHAYPMRYLDARDHTAQELLPGSACDFVMVFSVPKDTVLKDFIYTIQPVDGSLGTVDLRISLQ